MLNPMDSKENLESWGGKDLFHLILLCHSPSLREARTGAQSGTSRWKLKQRPWRTATCWCALHVCSGCFLTPSWTTCQVGMPLPVLAIPTSVIKREDALKLCPQATMIEAFLIWGFFFPDDSSLGQVDAKQNKTKQNKKPIQHNSTLTTIHF